MSRVPMDTERAKQLRLQGLKFREIGKILAEEEGRSTVYQAASVQTAITRHA